MWGIKLSTKDSRLAACFSLILIAAIVLLILGILNRFSVRTYQQSELARIADTASLTFQNNLESYIYAMYGVRALFNSTNLVTRTSFAEYVDSLALPRRLPGATALGYSRILSPAQQAAYELDFKNDTTVELNGYPNFAIHPANPTSEVLALTYVAPTQSTTNSSLGFNLLSETNRREAFEMARDTNRAVMTSTVQALGNKEDTFIMILPVYDLNQSVVSVSDRQASVTGAVTMSFRRVNLFNSSFEVILASNPGMVIKVYEGDQINPDKLLYDSDADKQVMGWNSDRTILNEVRTFDRAGKTWTIEYSLPNQKGALIVPLFLLIIPLLLAAGSAAMGLVFILRGKSPSFIQ